MPKKSKRKLTYKFQFNIKDLANVSYEHKEIKCMGSGPALREIISIIPLVNLLDTECKNTFDLVYIYYNSQTTAAGISGNGYLTSKTRNNNCDITKAARSCFAITNNVAVLLSYALFYPNSILFPEEISNIINKENVIMFDNETGNTLSFMLTIYDDIVTLEA